MRWCDRQYVHCINNRPYMGQNAKEVHLHQGDSTRNVRPLPHFWVATWYSEVECWPFVSEMYILIHSDIICIKLASENHVTTQKHGNGRTLPWHMHEERPIIWKNKNFIFFADAFWRRVPCAYFLWFLGPILSIFDNFWHKIIRTNIQRAYAMSRALRLLRQLEQQRICFVPRL